MIKIECDIHIYFSTEKVEQTNYLYWFQLILSRMNAISNIHVKLFKNSLLSIMGSLQKVLTQNGTPLMPLIEKDHLIFRRQFLYVSFYFQTIHILHSFLS